MMASDNSRPMYSARPGYEAVMVPGYGFVEDGAEGCIDWEDVGGGG